LGKGCKNPGTSHQTPSAGGHKFATRVTSLINQRALLVALVTTETGSVPVSALEDLDTELPVSFVSFKTF